MSDMKFIFTFKSNIIRVMMTGRYWTYRPAISLWSLAMAIYSYYWLIWLVWVMDVVVYCCHPMDNVIITIHSFVSIISLSYLMLIHDLFPSVKDLTEIAGRVVVLCNVGWLTAYVQPNFGFWAGRKSSKLIMYL